MEPDSAFLGLLNPVYYHDAWPGRAALDSIREADSGRYFATLAFMITDHGYYFGAHNASAAAVTFHLDGGPPELVLWSLDVIGLDYAREHVLMALPDHLSSAQEWVLLRHACTIAVQLEAMTPSLNDWGVLSGHDGSPMWYYAGVAELRLIVRRLSGERATNFDRIIAPVLANAEMLR